MRKTAATILLLASGLIAWIFTTKPEPPFGGAAPEAPCAGTVHFAEVDTDGTVLRVIVARREFIDSGAVGDPKNWVQTCQSKGSDDTYAGPGMKYEKTTKKFRDLRAEQIDAIMMPKTK